MTELHAPDRRGDRADRQALARHPRRRYLDQIRPTARAGRARGICPAATSPTASPPATATTRTRCAAAPRPNIAHRLRLQRHAVRPSAARALPDADQAGGRARPAAMAQFAGGVPAMCDGVTQGQPGMELSLFSRDVIALATAIGLQPRHVRRRPLSRHLRQDRAGPGDRRR